MLGAIAGDIIGSPFEFIGYKEYEFPLFSGQSDFTDDSVLTVAVADILMHDKLIAATLKSYAREYPNRGYGGSFAKWMMSDSLEPYNSWGNGAAMRTGPVGFLLDNEVDVLAAARDIAQATHNHPEGIRGAQAVAFAIFLARQGADKEELRAEITRWFGYDLSATLDEIRPGYRFDESCQGTVPPALVAFLESTDFEDAIRKAISLGGDADTLACITGSVAEAYYGSVPDAIARETRKRLPPEFLELMDKFYLMIED